MGSQSRLDSPTLTRGFCRITVATVLVLGWPTSIAAAGPETNLTTGTQQGLLAEASRRRPGEDEPPDETKTGYPRESTDGGRARPGTKPAPRGAEEAELPDPNRATGLKRVPPPPPTAPGDFIPVPDRWRLAKDLSLVKEPWYDPYNRNLLKADRPFYRDWFFNASVISDSIVELRQLPTPVAPQVSRGLGRLDTFGERDQIFFNQNLIMSLVVFKGDTVFRPPDYEFRITPVFNLNYTDVEELRIVNISPREGTTRLDQHIGLQDLFLDVHLRNVSDRYDFDSIRFGIQPFSTDFRGFLFQDNQLGVRLFGTRSNNLWQYNLAYFRRVEKDTNSGLNDIQQAPRDDEIVLGNLYRQDFPVRGFTSQGTVVYNRNWEENDPRFFDRNGVLVRPAPLGFQRNRDYDAVYLGYNGDGHFGRVNLTASFYYALGNESHGTFTQEPSNIQAWFSAAEASLDFDWIRARASVLYATGDEDPFDTKSEGFDAIFENPIFAGADTSYWIRQAVPNIGGGGVALSGRNAVLNSLRSSKEQGQSNFTNPGVELYGIGADFDISPQLRLSTNFNKLFFEDTTTLEVARNQGKIDSDIGWDLSAAFIYRPFFTQNIVTRFSVAFLVPGDGFKQLFGNETNYSILGNLIFTY